MTNFESSEKKKDFFYTKLEKKQVNLFKKIDLFAIFFD